MVDTVVVYKLASSGHAEMLEVESAKIGKSLLDDHLSLAASPIA